MMRNEYLVELEKQLEKNYKKEVSKGMLFEISQMDVPRFDLWTLKVEIGFEEGVHCKIIWEKEKSSSSFKMDFVMFSVPQKGIEKIEKERREFEQMILYYDMGKEIFLDWAQTVPELRMIQLLSPEKLLKETQNIKRYKKTFIQVKG